MSSLDAHSNAYTSQTTNASMAARSCKLYTTIFQPAKRSFSSHLIKPEAGELCDKTNNPFAAPPLSLSIRSSSSSSSPRRGVFTTNGGNVDPASCPCPLTGDLFISVLVKELPVSLQGLICTGAGGNTFLDDQPSLLSDSLNTASSSFGDWAMLLCGVDSTGGNETVDCVCFENLGDNGRICNFSRGTSA